MRNALLLLPLLLIPAPASAQSWTQEEQELIDHIKMCWDAWIDTRPQPDHQRFFERCPWSEDVSMWWTNDGMPQTLERTVRNWVNPPVDVMWLDLNPIAVRIWDDIGMVQMYAIWKAKTPEGLVNTEYKRTEIFRRVNGRWVFMGGQGTPVSAKDEDPYG